MIIIDNHWLYWLYNGYIYIHIWLVNPLVIDKSDKLYAIKKKNVYVLYNHCHDIWVFEKYIMII